MALLQKAYLGATPLFRSTSWFEDDARTLVDQSSAVTVTANTAAHTKGAWSQIIASSSSNASLVYVQVDGVTTNGADTRTLIDIGTGASGSESALIENVAVGGAVSSGLRGILYFLVPVQVPSGTRISARIQSLVTGGKTASVMVRLFDTGDYAQAPTSVDTLGTDTATSGGTAMTATNTYVELVSSASRAYRAVALVPSVQANGSNTIITKYTVGIGASGSEVEIGSSIACYTNAESATVGDGPLIVASIASGTRIAVKSDIAGVHSAYGVCLIGIP